MADKMQGKCLCGAVTVTAAKVSHVEACHCGMCRTWGGGPFMGVQCGDDTAIEGMDNITQFTSSDWATRGFCKSCGTHIFYQFNQLDTYVMPAGFFGEQSFEFTEQIFIDKKPSYYDFANDTAKLTEQQVFEKYMPTD